MTPVVESPPWTPKEDERLRALALSRIKCRGDCRADEAQQSSGPQPRSPVENCGGQVEVGAEREGEIAGVRFVSLSPPNKRSLLPWAPR
jgi:hypothetical protein